MLDFGLVVGFREEGLGWSLVIEEDFGGGVRVRIIVPLRRGDRVRERERVLCLSERDGGSSEMRSH